MFALVNWLRERPAVNIIVVILFYLLVTLPHEQVGAFIASIFKGQLRASYDFTILCLASAIFLFYIIPLFRSIFKNEDRNKLLFYFGVTFALTILSINTILILNIELIHFIQYAVMAILFFPLTLRYTDTLFWVTLLGALDEGFQYWFLAPERYDYYDFNDVIINMLGVLFGLLMIRTTEKVHALARNESRSIWKNSVVKGCIGLFVLFVLLWGVNILTIYPDASGNNGPILLVKKIQTSFWTNIHPNITYHVVRPLEGMIVLILLYLFYLPLWKKSPTTISS